MANGTLVPKGWGFEHIVANTPQYCGKRLFVLAGRKCSWHYHEVKDETFCVQSGRLVLRYGDADALPGRSHACPLFPGDVFHVPPGMRHQFQALEDTWLLEFSTHDDPADSIKLERGDVLPGPPRDGTPRLRLHPDGHWIPDTPGEWRFYDARDVQRVSPIEFEVFEKDGGLMLRLTADGPLGGVGQSYQSVRVVAPGTWVWVTPTGDDGKATE